MATRSKGAGWRPASAALTLAAVFMLAAAGIVYLAEPARADDCTPGTAITLGAAGPQVVDGVTFSLTWTMGGGGYQGFAWAVTAPADGTVKFTVDRSNGADQSAGPAATGSYRTPQRIDALYACGQTGAGAGNLGNLGNPRAECSAMEAASPDHAWNGHWWKVNLDWEGAGAQVEYDGVPAGAISYSLGSEHLFSWVNQHSEAVFAWFEKNGGPNDPDDPHLGYWPTGEGASDAVDHKLSHVTFCFSDPPAPPPADPARLTILKDAQPDDGGVWFGFTRDFGEGFQLSDPGHASEVFAGLPGGASYTVWEDLAGLPEGWEFSSVACWADDDPGMTDVNQATAAGAATVFLEPGDAVTCSFVNTRVEAPPPADPARLTILKDAQPDDRGARFEFTPSANWPGGAGPFQLGDGESTRVQVVVGETYRVEETGQPEGWRFASVSCVNGPGLPAPQYETGEGWLSISLADGDDVTCTFLNTRLPEPPGTGRIIVRKLTLPAGAPGQAFAFASSWGPGFSLGGGEAHESGPLAAPGTYSVMESGPLPTGWSLASASCSDGSAPSAIHLHPNETVTCTFVNTFQPEVRPRSGSLTIIKVATSLAGGEAAEFSFTINLDPSAFYLADGEAQVFDGLAAGSYTVSELPAGPGPGTVWKLERVDCTAGSFVVDPERASVTVNLAEGEAAVCTFYNREEYVAGPELPYTGPSALFLPLLIGGLLALLAGLGLVVGARRGQGGTS